MTHANLGCQFRLEGVDVRANRGDPVGTKCLFDEVPFVFGEMGGGEEDRLIQIAAQMNVGRSSILVHDGDLIDSVSIHQREHCRGRRPRLDDLRFLVG